MAAVLTTVDIAPRTSLTLAGMMDRIRGDLAMRDQSLLTDPDLTGWLNEGQDEIARATGWFRTFTLVGTVAGTKEYALPSEETGRCIQIEEIVRARLPLIEVSLEQLQAWDPFYRNGTTGTPTWWYPRGSAAFGLHYTPNETDTSALTVVYVALPPRIVAAEDFFYVPHGGQRLLLLYAKMLASEKDAHGEGAKRLPGYQAQWSIALAEMKKQVGSLSERHALVIGERGDDWTHWNPRVPWPSDIHP